VSFILCLNFVENVRNEKEMETTPSGDLNHSNAPSDIVNNNSELQRTGEEVTKKDITQTGSASLTESMSPFSPIGTKTDVTKPHLLTQDGVTSEVEMHERKRQENPPQQCTESNEHQQIISTHSMVTDSRKGLEGKKSNIHELTQKFEDTVNIENCPKGEQDGENNTSPLKREISHSSADGSESEEDSDAESSSSDEDKDQKDNETPGQQTGNKKENKKTKLSKKELKRMKKKERKKRRKKRKIDSTEKESGTDSNNIPAASTNKQESLTSKVICIRLRLCKF
jgi:hypothetical protein